MSIWTAVTGTLIESGSGAIATNTAQSQINTGAASFSAVTAVKPATGGQAMSSSARSKAIRSAATSFRDSSNWHTLVAWSQPLN